MPSPAGQQSVLQQERNPPHGSIVGTQALTGPAQRFDVGSQMPSQHWLLVLQMSPPARQ